METVEGMELDRMEVEMKQDKMPPTPCRHLESENKGVMLGKIKPQIFLICFGLIGLGAYTAYLGLTEIAAACAAGLVATAGKLIEQD